MSIKIHTYADPYKLDQEPYWDEIKNCPYFCASQTLVNGLRSLYTDCFPKGHISTVRNLEENIFEYWESTECIIRQHAAIDNIINRYYSDGSEYEKKIFGALLFNREEVFESLRTMFELDISDDTDESCFSDEQKCIFRIFKEIKLSESKKDFVIDDICVDEIDTKIIKALTTDKNPDSFSTTIDTVVIHGVHQFTPVLLRIIEELSKSKKVILLFNYQLQYKNIYQTWIDIYNEFDSTVEISEGHEFTPNKEYSASYKGNVLADNLGKLSNGQTRNIVFQPDCEVLEFDNMTEFASYVADIFEDAKHKNAANPMTEMKEQIYAADSSVNDILRIYFPEQFGERQFLDYPLGRFFLAIANMWDPTENEIKITDINDIKECLQAGILTEDYFGELSSIFGKISALFEGCTSIDEMLRRLKRLRKIKKHTSSDDIKEYISHISYFNIEQSDIEKMENALKDLDELASYFYEDFDQTPHNFKRFYKNLKQYLSEDILSENDLDAEFADIIRRVLDRLCEVEDIDTSASFQCLKVTMSIYLTQETKPGGSANWIVRNFEQIDGDTIRSRTQMRAGKTPVYHYACLSDENMNSVNIKEFTWPLNEMFFENSNDFSDWKIHVFVKSRKEYRNYKRYALLYGLEFNRGSFKLSYVKRQEDKEHNLYSLLKILGVDKVKYEETRKNRYLESVDVQTEGHQDRICGVYDYYRYKICRYRFLLESLIEGTTVYKDTFLLVKYLEVILENQLKEQMQGYPVSEAVLIDKLNDIFDDMKKYFPFVVNMNRMDIINNVRNRILNSKQKLFPVLGSEEKKNMMIRELFIHKYISDPKKFKRNILSDKFPDISEEQAEKELSKIDMKFEKTPDLWCQFCADRESCAAYYARDNT